MKANLLTERNIAETAKRIAVANKFARPNRLNALARLEAFVGRDVYVKALDRVNGAAHFASGPYKCEKAKAYPAPGKDAKEHLDYHSY